MILGASLAVGFQDPDDDGLPPLGRPLGQPRILVPGGTGAMADAEDAAIAGLPQGARPQVLTWERVYALALIRARSGRANGGATSFDPAWLYRESKQVGVADFARFRADFLAGPPAFHDPAPAMLEVLRLRQAVDDGLRSVKVHERYFRAAMTLRRDDAPGLTNLTIDRIDDAVQQARVELVARRRRFRDALDALKVELGLAPEAAVVPDRTVLAAFGDAFDTADRWLTDPSRGVAQLDAIGKRLPELDDVAIDGRSIVAELRGGSESDDELLRAAARVARRIAGSGRPTTTRSRPGSAARCRALQETYLAYALASRRLELRVRRLDPGGPFEDTSLGAALGELLQVEDRLVDLWTQFQMQRLALLRDLGIMPGNDWPEFLASLQTIKREPGRR